MYNAKAYSAASATSPLASTTITRRDPTEHDVQIEILFCGICHSDLHQVRNEWSGVMPTVYPCVPGHEIVGRVTQGRLRGLQVQARRPRRRWLHGGFRRHLPRVPGGPGAVLPEHVPHLQLPRQAPRRRHLRRLLGQHRRGPAVCPAASLRTSTLREPLLCFAPESRRTRRCVIGASQRARKSASSVSADWATWA